MGARRRQRQSVERDNIVQRAEGAGEALRDQPENRSEVEEAGSVADLPTGPKDHASTVLSIEEEAVIVAFRGRRGRRWTMPERVQPTIPHLTRSALHRRLQCHEVSRLAQVEGEASPKRKFKAYPIGYFHIDIAEVRTAEGKLYLLVAIDRTSKFAFVELRETVSRRDAADFLRRLIEAALTRSSRSLPTTKPTSPIPLATPRSPVEIREMIAERKPFRAHAFEYACATNDVDHRLTKPKHPWTNGQVERMNCTIKDATVKRYSTNSLLKNPNLYASAGLRQRLQLRQKAQDPQRPHPLRIHL